MVYNQTDGTDMDSGFRHGLMVQSWTHGIGKDSWYGQGLMVQTWTHGIVMDSWYRQELMVQTWTHGINETHGIDSDSCNSIGIPESHKYKRAEWCPYAGF